MYRNTSKCTPRKSKKILTFVLAALLLSTTMQAPAEQTLPTHPTSGTNPEASTTAHLQIAQSVAEFLHSFQEQSHFKKLDISTDLPDTRVHLKLCSVPPEVSSKSRNRNYGRLTLQVACRGTQPWVVYVPVNIRAYDTVVVASRSIPRGSVISRNLIELKEVEVSRLYQGYFKDPEAVIGAVAKRSIAGNKVLSPGKISPPRLVSKGEKVTIVAEGRHVRIKANGIAMTDGAYGDLVQVKNARSNRVVEGRVTAAGQITVNL